MSEHESTETEVLDSTDSVEPADLSEQLGGDAEGDSTDASAAADDPIAAAMQALAADEKREALRQARPLRIDTARRRPHCSACARLARPS